MSKKDDRTAKTKPFPWKCQNCGQRAVHDDVVSYPVSVEYDNRTYNLTVPGLKAPRCQKCGEVFPDAEANRQISAAFRYHAKLLTPQQVRNNRVKLGLTQKQIAGALAVAEASISRWETGAQIQQRSLDRLLRLFFEYQQVREALMDEERAHELGTEVVPQLAE